jgi:hypothetical protein
MDTWVFKGYVCAPPALYVLQALLVELAGKIVYSKNPKQTSKTGYD